MNIWQTESKTLTCCCEKNDPEPLQAKLERLLNVDQEISIQALLEMDWIQRRCFAPGQAWFDRDYDWAGPPLARSDRWQDPEGI